METHNRILFERMMQELDTLIEYTLHEGDKLKLLMINTSQSEYGIITDYTDYIINNIIQEYWGKNTKDELKFQKLPFKVDK